jgi:hypothetical protein
MSVYPLPEEFVRQEIEAYPDEFVEGVFSVPASLANNAEAIEVIEQNSPSESVARTAGIGLAVKLALKNGKVPEVKDE